MPGEIPLRCFCPRNTLLGVVKRDVDGRYYVHVRVHKSQRNIANLIIESGVFRTQCRDCGRWHKLTVQRASLPEFAPEQLPTAVQQISS